MSNHTLEYSLEAQPISLSEIVKAIPSLLPPHFSHLNFFNSRPSTLDILLGICTYLLAHTHSYFTRLTLLYSTLLYSGNTPCNDNDDNESHRSNRLNSYLQFRF